MKPGCGCSAAMATGLLKGFNIYHILEGMEYLHGSSFDLARKELEVENIAYSNAVINDTEVYYACIGWKMPSGR